MDIDVKALDKIVSATYGKSKERATSKEKSEPDQLKENSRENNKEPVKDTVTLTKVSQEELEAHRETVKKRLKNGYYSAKNQPILTGQTKTFSQQEKDELAIAQRVLSHFESPKGYDQTAQPQAPAPQTQTKNSKNDHPA